ncbi:helix-turn-helix domain-containing protein [Methylobacterium sp. 092160098-2]|uniref:XRE family transcriptional regulator n=1 Tax=Methylobacterium sp. 092160098-2 TaxID=3025129 RepID=UPI002381A192|nr:helix-turn-helix domain-containing protein [Methylobacterium sp. 092160098-2]MDE4910359.1 helix-turn-helix domain-containing protein [Methylobacterium sp. 092160098-2]
MANNLARLRQDRGWSQDYLAGLMGTTRNQLAKLEGGSRRLSDVWIERAAKALGVDAGALVTTLDEVTVVGDVGAGGRVIYHGEEQGGSDRAERPPRSSSGLVAVRVQGDSMPGVAEDQWLIYYDERVHGVPDEWLGKVCVVWLPDDRVFVKRIYRGRDPGTFDLVSTGSYDPMRDEEVAYSAIVRFTQQR